MNSIYKTLLFKEKNALIFLFLAVFTLTFYQDKLANSQGNPSFNAMDNFGDDNFDEMLNEYLQNQILEFRSQNQNSKNNKNQFDKDLKESSESRTLLMENLFKDFQKSFEKKFLQTDLNPIEEYYTKRSGLKLHLQGYEFLDFRKSIPPPISILGSISDDYLMGPGDKIRLILSGELYKQFDLKVDREGLIYLENISQPIFVTGKKFSDVKNEIINKINNIYIETQAFVTLSELKQITVKVSGEVNEPGVINLPAISTVLDAILMASGIKKGGSLRNIKLIKNGKTQIIDLYSLIYGDFETLQLDINLTNNALIIIPPLSKTFALSGDFAKPGIYEIGQNSKSINEIIEFNGGFSLPGQQNVSIQDVNGEYLKATSDQIEDGDIIFATSSSFVDTNYVKIKGSVFREKLFLVNEVPTISSLLSKEDIYTENKYNFAAILKSFDETKKDFSFEIINLWDIQTKDQNKKLKSKDEIIFLSLEDIDFFNNFSLLSLDSCKAHEVLRETLKAKKTPLYNFFRKEQKSNISCPNIFLNNLELMSFVFENLIYLDGENFQNSGFYLVNENFSIDSLLEYIGTKEKNYFKISNKIITLVSNKINLKGPFKYETSLDYKEGVKISDIINYNTIKSTGYKFFGIVYRKYSPNGTNNIIFNPQNVIELKNDFEIQKDDTIQIFSEDEVSFFQESHKEHLKKLDNNDNNKISNDDNMSQNSEKVNVSELNQNLTYDNLIDPNSINYNNMKLLNKISQDNRSETDIRIEKTNTIPIVSDLKKSKEFQTNKQYFNYFENYNVEIKGSVVMPGFYPLGGEINLIKMLNVAGGLKVDGDIRNVEIYDVKGDYIRTSIIKPGYKIVVPNLNIDNDKVSLTGSVLKKRYFGKGNLIKLSQLLTKERNNFTKDAYMYFGYIKRKDKINNTLSYQAFSPLAVLLGKQDFTLNKGDEINILNEKDIENLLSLFSQTKKDITPDTTINSEYGYAKSYGSLESMVGSLIINIQGEIVKPGNFLLGGNYNLESILNLAGGLNNNADLKNIKVNSPTIDENKKINFDFSVTEYKELLKKVIVPGTYIKVSRQINDLSLGVASIEGQVLQPGNYRIIEGESIFSLLKRSGGLKKGAYLFGLVFSRESEKRREKLSIDRLRRELEKSITAAIEQNADKGVITAATISALSELSIRSLDYDPTGRVVGNYASLETIKNTKVKNGDKIFIPSTPTSVSVVGEVMSPGSITWNKKLQVKDYINTAAGFTSFADKKNIFVISPNGQATKQSGLWMQNHNFYPGSIIVVPRKIELTSNITRASAITSIFYQLTIALAGIDNLLD